MSIPIRQQFKVARYILEQRLRGRRKYPLVLMLEPLFQCNLACSGCGKIDYPNKILNKRLSVEECLSAVDECGAPIVSIPGGEPLIHKDMPEIVSKIVERKKFVYLCTNAVLLKKRIGDYTPSPYLAFSIHLDGNQHHHDASVCRQGVFDKAVEAIQLARKKGYRVNVNCTLFQDQSANEVVDFFNFVTELDIEGITVSPGFSYERAPIQDNFLQRHASKQLFRDIFSLGKKQHWNLNHSSLFLDFLAGNQSYQCTPWGNPTRNIFGWQRPCYLLVDEGYAPTFKTLMEETDWDKYGVGRNPKCGNCMAHCGFEPSAVNDSLSHPLKALRVSITGPRTEGMMVPEPVMSDTSSINGEHGKLSQEHLASKRLTS